MYRKSTLYIVIVSLLCLMLLNSITAISQELVENTVSAETVDAANDSLSNTLVDSSITAHFVDSLSIDSISPKKKRNAIDAEIAYQATDSIVFFANGKGYLYNKGTVDYKDIQLKADFIEMDIDSSQVFAQGVKDSLGNIAGNPVFKEGSDSYESRTIRYNFDTKKGFIQHVVTQQGDGYVISENTKKTADDLLYMRDGRYTTCANHEHPHFYLNLTKAKVKPKSFIATGPAYFVLEDVPLPLAIPFGFFPFSDTYSSGVIMPTFGDEYTRGFFLREGGYYFALSDYFDFALTGDIYTKGSWALRGASSYVKRYKYRGNFNASRMVSIISEKGLPDYLKSVDFSLTWQHNQDTKANIYRTLAANVNFMTSSYQHNNVSTYNAPLLLAENTKSSSVSLTQRIPNTPFSIALNTTVNQRTKDSTINMSLPDLSVSMTRTYPFKRRDAVGKARWYEKIYMSYTGRYLSSITAKEQDFFQASYKYDWEKGAMHNIPIAASFQLFKYLTISPTFNYNERWYFTSVDKSWDIEQNKEIVDTTYGFHRAGDFNFGIGLDTKLYGFFKPSPAIFGDKIEMIRWVITPNVGYSMMPDFGAETFGYWGKYVRAYQNGEKEIVSYSHYDNLVAGAPPTGKSGSVSFGIANNVEMKLNSKKDSTGIKKISLIDNFSLSSSYNLAVDSMNWSNIVSNLRLRFTDNFGLSLTASFDPYEYKLAADGKSPIQVNDYRWNHGKLPQLISTSTSFGYSISNETFKKKEKTEESLSTDEDGEESLEETASIFDTPEEEKKLDDNGYTKFTMPWSIGFDYDMRYGRSEFDIEKLQYKLDYSHSISFNGTLALTPKWNITGSLSYDITQDEITYTSLNITRDLHCWSMSASIVPIGLYTSYMFTIRVNSSLLQDLKYEQRGNSLENVW